MLNAQHSIVTAVAALLMGYVAAGGGTTAEVRMQLEKENITLHAPVILDIRVQAPSAENLDFDPGYNWENIEIRVTDPDDRLQTRPAQGLSEGMKFSQAIHVESGSAQTISLVVSDWFPFDEPGTYQLEVILKGAPFSTVHANLSLQVGPRDDQALETECGELLNRVGGSQSLASALVAARALSDVRDPLVVPYLARAMKRREFVSLMVTALAKLNTRDAVDALKQASKSPDQETSRQARSALSALGYVREE